MKNSILALLFFSCISLFAQDQLYKVTLLRAKPGELLTLIDSLNQDIANYEKHLEYRPYLLRHTQGDHWDLMMIYPISDLDDYFSDLEIQKRANSTTLEKTYGHPYFDIVSFQEEALVLGPPADTFIEHFDTYELFHIEIFTALAGKQEELLSQRKAENEYYAGIDHRPNFIFTRVFGPSWDIFTIGYYTDWHDFAGPELTFEAEDKAAKDAGFEGVNFIGSYLRSLLTEHRDTFAWKVKN